MGKLYGWIIGIHWGLYIGNLGKELYIIWAGRSLLKWILLSTKELGNGQDRGMLYLEKLLLTLLLCIQTVKGKTSLFGFPVQMGYTVPPRHGILSELVNQRCPGSIWFGILSTFPGGLLSNGWLLKGG